MATRATGGKATKPAKSAKAAPKATKAPAKAAKPEKDARIVATALMDRKSAEFKALPERMQNWVKKCQDEGWAYAIKNVHRILEHNHGLFLVSTTTGKFQVGTMSASGKSFNIQFESEDRNEAIEFYRDNRTGNYGADADEAPAKPAKKAAKPAAKASKKAAKPAKKSAKKSKTIQADEDEDDLLDD